jgi:hypothetical protein
MNKPVNQPDDQLHWSMSRRIVIAAVLVVVMGIVAWNFGAAAPVKATPLRHSTAQDVVITYFNDINAKDYYSAYLLWGRDFQSKNSYSAFASGFANTLRDEGNVTGTEQQADGTVRVDVTFYATESVPSGTQISTFQGWYIVGPEDGSLKLLSANIQRVA